VAYDAPSALWSQTSISIFTFKIVLEHFVNSFVVAGIEIRLLCINLLNDMRTIVYIPALLPEQDINLLFPRLMFIEIHALLRCG